MDSVITESFKKTILKEALKIFKENGVRELPENELSKKLGISQSTITHLAPTREDLFKQCILLDVEEQHTEREEVLKGKKNPVEQLMILLRNSLERTKGLSPVYMRDIMSYPWIHELIEKELEGYITPMYYNLLNEGIRQNVFRKDINLAVVTKVIIQNLQVLLNPKVFPPDQFSVGEVMRSIYLYYFRGLCTAESAGIVDEYFAEAN